VPNNVQTAVTPVPSNRVW